MWPACKAPIVGTRPIDLASRRHARDRSRMALASSITTGGASAAVPDLFPVLCWSRSVGCVLMLRARELPGADVLGIGRRRPRDLFGQVGVTLDELRRLAGGQAEHIVQHEHLPVCARTRADADRRN